MLLRTGTGAETLVEGADMEKAWYKSKTKWAGIVLGVGELMKLFPITAPFAPIAEAVAAALGAFGIRDALVK